MGVAGPAEVDGGHWSRGGRWGVAGPAEVDGGRWEGRGETGRHVDRTKAAVMTA